MKKPLKYNSKVSIKDLFDYIEPDSYTRQTIATIFRCFLETIIENRYPSVILARLKNLQGFQGLLNRLKYTESKVYSYSGNIEEFKQVKLEHPGLENDEFLVIIAERFSACIYWNESESDVFGLCEGFCSMNPEDAKLIIELLQDVAYDSNVEKDLSEVLQDRRNNEKFTTILRKLVTSLESRQRDLICANTELKDLCQKSLQTEKLATLGGLCSTIAHELRNPLGMIDLHAKIILKSVEKLEVKGTETLLNSANILSKATQNLEKLLTELIDYSKPMILEKTQTNLEKHLLEVVGLVQPSFEERKVGILFENLLNNNYKILFDAPKLYQAVLNLVINALEISKPGDAVKIVADYNQEDNLILIKISDEGPGISSANLEKIFTPYFTTKSQGTGLGLAQSRKILEAHGGSLFISSTGAKGTTFVLTLPIESI